MAVTAAARRDLDGRPPGRRGLQTRRRLLATTVVLLRERPYRDLTVVEIARRAGTSPATFYQYFADVESAVLALGEEVAQEGSETLVPLVADRTWRGRSGLDAAGAVVDGFIDFWERHGPVVRVMDLATNEGDARFQKLRSRLFTRFNDALAELVGRERAGRGATGIDPRATAGAMTSMLAHVADHRYGFEFYGIRTDDLRATMTEVLFSAVTGRRPPTG